VIDSPKITELLARLQTSLEDLDRFAAAVAQVAD